MALQRQLLPLAASGVGAMRNWKLSLVLALLTLQACGGDSSSLSNGSGAAGSLTGPTVLEGVYHDATNQFVGIALPDKRWFALYKQNGSIVPPDIFTGGLSLGINKAASFDANGLKSYLQKSLIVENASGTFTNASASTFQLNLAGILDGSNNSFSFTATGGQSEKTNNYVLTNTTWTNGKWADSNVNRTVSGPATVSFDPAGTGSTHGVFLANCTTSTFSINKIQGIDAYAVTLSIPDGNNLCKSYSNRGVSPNAVLFNGVAFLHSSGASRILEIIVVDSTGSGITYRGVAQ